MRFVNASLCLFLAFTNVRYLLGIDMAVSFCRASFNHELEKCAITDGTRNEPGPQDYRDGTQR